jgi:hypothetical protein
MGTGIVSTALALDHRETVSRILLVIAVLVWIVLGLVLAARSLQDPKRTRREAGSPAALTGVAGTAVLGARLTALGWSWAGAALLSIATLSWIILVALVLRGWTTPALGTSLLLTVSTESLAVLAATLAGRDRTDWLLYAGFAGFLLGVVSYGLVMSRFDLGQLMTGRGDQWITGGALAISALAAGQITLAAGGLHVIGGLVGALKAVSIVLWAVAVAWLPALAAAEILRPRFEYDVRRWSTVFPVGMYAACSFVVGAAARAHGITNFAMIWVWVSLAVWMIVFVAMLGRLARDT